MPSYQRDYPFNENLIVKAVEDWKASDIYKKLCNDRDYFNGDNVTIRELKKYYWSDPKKIMDNGTEKLIGGGFKENKFVSNNKIGYGFYPDMVKQKVNTLLTETPQIAAAHSFKPQFIKNLGYSIKQAGHKAAGQGVCYLYLDWQNNLTVFKPECCIPYYDDMNGNLTALIRFWQVDNKGTVIYYIETYTQAGLTTYTTDNHFQVIKPLTPYKFRKIIDFQGITIQGEQIGLPIIVFRNDDNLFSDLRPNIRAKIDAIDVVQSGFANNIDDFSELYWVIKNNSGMDEATFLDFQASINRTKKIVVGGDDDVDTKQITIPTEARTKFIELMKSELVEDSGVIDTKNMTGSSLTTTAIKAAIMKLKQRVSDFEWEAYKTVTDIIKMYQAYNNLAFDFEIDFTKLFIQNDTEMIDNLVKIRADVSRETALNIIKKAGYIDDVKKEQERIETESINAVSVVDNDDGQGT